MDILWTCAPALHEACLTDRPLPQALPSLGVLQIWSTGLSGSLPQTWFQPGAWQKLRFVQVLNNSGISGVVAGQLYFRGCAVMDLRLWVRKTCPAQLSIVTPVSSFCHRQHCLSAKPYSWRPATICVHNAGHVVINIIHHITTSPAISP